jgi:predicted ATPase
MNCIAASTAAAGTCEMSAYSEAPKAQQTLTVKDRAFTVTSARAEELIATFEHLCSAATSTVDLPTFINTASKRPDAFRMTSRLQLVDNAPRKQTA